MTVRDATIKRLFEVDMTSAEESDIALLLDECFINTFNGRTFFKQIPHARLLMRQNNQLVGHLGLDYRVIRANKQILKVVGIIDVCVHPFYRRRGYGTLLLQHAERVAHSGQASHMILFADCHDLYLNNGYVTSNTAVVKWMAIEDLETHSIQCRDCAEILLSKGISSKFLLEGEIDLLGYLL